ncbi:MAG: MBL fold metallo-hydrolase [Gallintestinimicrobium sp.]
MEAILLTHGHFDHIGGAAELKKSIRRKGVCIGRREESLPDAGVKPVCPDAPCCDDRSG